ncbi:uncharacterized protein ARMOST_04830 [Armillaria ostoyae]|uniref:ACB domain-containing protein n=1 Tax=Armillaria ostoyae TaxID=47428 RepID=A0A284QYG5_ARMOS|nr:uncharacterized protein ARMOST_04830 [Armillaria ostoyae]
MSSNELIDAQFDRAVEIVQGLPKTGPIQTDYEEKLTMYSLYKQATVGNVKSPRPAMWDMLGRAKWDAWAKHKDLDSYEAKWLYVDALLKVLRKYSDKTVAKSLVEELEAYGGDPFNLVMSGTMSRSRASSSSSSTASDEVRGSPYIHQIQPHSVHSQQRDQTDSGSEVESSADEAGELPNLSPEQIEMPQPNRPQSSQSSHRYRTPMTGSLAMSPPPAHGGVPVTQPLPGFETPSAFGDSPTPAPSSVYPTSQFSQSSRNEVTGSPHIYPSHPQFRGQSQPILMSQFGPYVPVRPATRPTLERAVENVQAQLAAMGERIESIESIYLPSSRSHSSLGGRRLSPSWAGPRGRSPGTGPEWDYDDLGMWSLVLNPISRGVEQLRELAKFFSKNEHRSPSAIILRRLCLDASFLLCVLAFVRILWKKSGVRRREVYAALVVLWNAILGTKHRTMVDTGV